MTSRKQAKENIKAYSGALVDIGCDIVAAPVNAVARAVGGELKKWREDWREDIKYDSVQEREGYQRARAEMDLQRRIECGVGEDLPSSGKILCWIIAFLTICAILAVVVGGARANAAALANTKVEFGMQEDYNKNGEIYRAYCRPTGKSYIGQTVSGMEMRRRLHESDARLGGKTALCAALRKYGKEAFDWEVLAQTCGVSCSNALEKAYISLFNTLAPGGYNLTPGGKNGFKTKETRRKMSEAKKGKPLSESHRTALSVAGKKRFANPAERAKTSRTTKKAMWRPEVRQKSVDRKMSAEAVEKMAATKRGKPQTAAHRAAISAGLTGYKRPPFSAEHRAKLSAAQKRRFTNPANREILRQKNIAAWTPEKRAQASAKARGETA